MTGGVTKKSKSALFLIELMIAILFFALSSAVCAQLFAKAHLISQKSGDVTMAVNRAQSVAEEFRSGVLQANNAAMEAETVYYDGEWSEVSQDKAVYELTVTPEKGSSDLVYAEIKVQRIGGAEPLFELSTGVYTG